MKALTLTQPWASLVALGAKRIETRSWATSHRGPLAIHAAASLDPVGGLHELWKMCNREPFRSVLIQHQILNSEGLIRQVALHRGAIVAVAELVSCEPTDGPQALQGGWLTVGQREGPWPLTDQERAFGDYSPGRWGWLLADVRPLSQPVACRGSQGLWRVPAGAAAQIAQQIGI